MEIAVSGLSARADPSLSAVSAPLLSMYMVPPMEELSVDEFEGMAIARLQVLRKIDVLKGRGLAPSSMEWQQTIGKVINKHGLRDVRTDHISHFILRLAYCKSEDLRRWLMMQETALFKYRFEKMTPEQQTRFLRDNDMHYERVRADSDIELHRDLTDVHNAQRYGGERTPLPAEFFRIPFVEATALIKRREVLLRGGAVYVPMPKLVSIIVARFRSHLSGELAYASRVLPAVAGDRRIAPVVAHLSTQYTGPDTGRATAGAVTPPMLDSLARESMPLCMGEMHRTLRRDHKLKHTGRLQYSLFLKGIGLSLEDALFFWRQEFTKVMTDDQFQKGGYVYNIRFNYGKEGKRQNYTPHGCASIINAVPGSGETHGCPFRSYNEPNVRNALAASGVGPSDIQSVVNLVKSRDYQLACRKHFEVTHRGAASDDVGNHPNAWFDASREFRVGEAPALAVPEVEMGAAAAVAVTEKAAAAVAGPADPEEPMEL